VGTGFADLSLGEKTRGLRRDHGVFDQLNGLVAGESTMSFDDHVKFPHLN
jgi:hypothetical protein